MPNAAARSDIITPIGARSAATPARKRSLRRDIDLAMFALAAVTALVTFGVSVYFAYGFAQTDRGGLTLLSSFALCFGLGALAYVPSAITAVIARQSSRGAVSVKGYVTVFGLILPWLVTACVFVFASALPMLYGLAALLISVVLLVWAAARLRHAAQHVS